MVAALGRRVVQGDYTPGEVLDLEAIAAEFDVSRTVVREAVRALSARGLLDALPHRGTFVREPSEWRALDADVLSWRGGKVDPAFLSDLAEVRRAIEPAGAMLAAGRRDTRSLGLLGDALDEMAVAVGRRDAAGIVTADMTFHRTLLAASGNGLLAALEVVLEPALRLRGEFAFTRPYGDEFVGLHRAVLDAVAAEEPDAARIAMENLLSEAAQLEVGSTERR